MKYIVSGGATLSFPDGTRFELSQGIHDASIFPENVKKHWAFNAYVKPLDEADLVKEQQSQDMAARITLLEGENTSLKALLVDRESAITELSNENTSLKAQAETKQDKAEKKQEAGNGKKQSSADS
ncbi:STY1053 family phage-associated protein [Xenorhabdus bovienii]|uniref:STY1053 family phage-associated protein n=1 Tax=Xenorhabdus bovienii TaxID=40576 RepID=UPI003DA24E8B